MSADPRVLRDDPYVDWGAHGMQFRLTYEGEVLADTNKGKKALGRADHKMEIRKKLHPQIRRLYELNPFLVKGETPYPGEGPEWGRPGRGESIDQIANNFKRNDYRFVPLVRESLDVYCSLDVLFLREHPAGGVLKEGGDIDNRLKTVFDALTMPRDGKQLGKYVVPEADEDPFFCLLEDDSLVTRATVEADTLLSPVIKKRPMAYQARVIITVRTQSYYLRPDNSGYAS